MVHISLRLLDHHSYVLILIVSVFVSIFWYNGTLDVFSWKETLNEKEYPGTLRFDVKIMVI